jgi:hypothetical protein
MARFSALAWMKRFVSGTTSAAKGHCKTFSLRQG